MRKESVPHSRHLTAVYLPCEEGGYSAFIEEISGVNTQGETLEEARENLMEALDMVLQVKQEMAESVIGHRKVTKEYLSISI